MEPPPVPSRVHYRKVEMYTQEMMKELETALRTKIGAGPDDFTIEFHDRDPWSSGRSVDVMLEWELYDGGDAENGPSLDVTVNKWLQISEFGSVALHTSTDECGQACRCEGPDECREQSIAVLLIPVNGSHSLNVGADDMEVEGLADWVARFLKGFGISRIGGGEPTAGHSVRV